jgi:glycogen synthase
MRVLMLGWEFPPFISGGLGTACLRLTNAMKGMGVDELFMLPQGTESDGAGPVQILGRRIPLDHRSNEPHGKVTILPVPSRLASPYAGLDAGAMSGAAGALRTEGQQSPLTACPGVSRLKDHYGGNLLADVHRYANACAELAQDERPSTFFAFGRLPRRITSTFRASAAAITSARWQRC